ncbi:hypothetical protein [Modestobacter sp. VKM Ac-2985]|uniref:hypothetical protein n=1 Tax=Modestobacter sp. VKM Ac-2985 TaxID=3004139 RepID=UPI0022AB9CE1|nr:hypothetical protein [Modestobacter sp. VKM Ac-2985]MCZ2837155.1 hypothetical protein [Modestobacter sp. VKM Ac-2985]
MTGTELAISAATPLASAVVAGLVALLVASRSARSSRRNWLLDERHDTYAAFLDAANDVLGGVTGPQQKQDALDPTKLRALMHALQRLDLVSPADVRAGAQAVRDTIPRHQQSNLMEAERRFGELMSKVNALVALLREDLVPKHMR